MRIQKAKKHLLCFVWCKEMLIGLFHEHSAVGNTKTSGAGRALTGTCYFSFPVAQGPLLWDHRKVRGD